jgi:hypothetical protein
MTPGELRTTMGYRGRTVVKRVTDAAGHRASVRVVEGNEQQTFGLGCTSVYIGRSYTGVPRSKPYPYAGAKRGGISPPLVPERMGGLAKATKRVLVNSD